MTIKQRSSNATHVRQIMKWLVNVGCIIAFCVASGWGFFVLQNPQTLPFRTIKIVVTNHHHINLVLLKKVVMNNLQGGFFSLRVHRLQQALLGVPWIYAVSFRRLWPDELLINVQEQQAVARWGEDKLLNAQGGVFAPPLATFPKNLAMLTGPLDSQQDLLQRFRRFSQELLPLGLRITAMSVNARYAWQLTLNDHILIVLGREDIDQRMLRLINLYPRVIGGQQSNVGRIDLRYPNGIAIQWKVKLKD